MQSAGIFPRHLFCRPAVRTCGFYGHRGRLLEGYFFFFLGSRCSHNSILVQKFMNFLIPFTTGSDPWTVISFCKGLGIPTSRVVRMLVSSNLLGVNPFFLGNSLKYPFSSRICPTQALTGVALGL